MALRVNLLNQKFNRLLVIKLIGPKSKRNYWLCRCDCGNEIEVSTGSLTSKNTQSCGCYNNDRIKSMSSRQTWSRKGPGEAGFNRLFRVYKKDAKKRDYSFNLTENEFKDLTSKNCHYCNSSPGSIKYGSLKGMTEEGLKYSRYIYNGIDRKQNDIGYTLDNVVTCCSKCNKLKGTLNYEEFIQTIRSIYANLCN